MRSGFPYDPTVEPSFREAIPSDLDRSWIADELLALAADKAARAGELVGE
jgi:D-alanyl-D-alanine carboxypeptidase